MCDYNVGIQGDLIPQRGRIFRRISKSPEAMSRRVRGSKDFKARPWAIFPFQLNVGILMIQVGNGWVLLDQVDTSLRFLGILVMKLCAMLLIEIRI